MAFAISNPGVYQSTKAQFAGVDCFFRPFVNGIIAVGTPFIGLGTVTNLAGQNGETKVTLDTSVGGIAATWAERITKISEGYTFRSGSVSDAGVRRLRFGSNAAGGAGSFAVTTAYLSGQVVGPYGANNLFFKVTAAGTSASTVPVWTTTAGSTVTSGTVTFTAQVVPEITVISARRILQTGEFLLEAKPATPADQAGVIYYPNCTLVSGGNVAGLDGANFTEFGFTLSALKVDPTSVPPVIVGLTYPTPAIIPNFAYVYDFYNDTQRSAVLDGIYG